MREMLQSNNFFNIDEISLHSDDASDIISEHDAQLNTHVLQI